MTSIALPLPGLPAAMRSTGQRLAALGRAHPRETVALGVLGASLVAIGSATFAIPSLVGIDEPIAAEARLPAAPPLLVKPLPVDAALAENQAIPLSDGPNPAALPFEMGKANAATRAQALDCLTSAIYYEAGQESTDGQRGVAQVVLNRVRHPAFPSSVCGVVYEGSTRITGCQFTFTCDGSLNRRPDAAGWNRARQVAQAALDGAVYGAVGWATHYHANYVVPYWASSLAKNAVVGAHIFYRWSGNWGRQPSFAQGYARSEPNPAALRLAALSIDRTKVAVTPPTDVAEAIEKLPGAQALPTVLTKRGEKQVAVRFTMAAREAVEKAVAAPKAEPVQTSDNLRWTLSGQGSSSTEKPLGKPAADATTSAGGAGL